MDSAVDAIFDEDDDQLQRCAMHYTSSDGTRRTLHYRAKEEVRVFFLFASASACIAKCIMAAEAFAKIRTHKSR